MNFPSTTGGNWSWRFTWDQIDANLAIHYHGLTHLYERPPKPKEIEEIEVAEESQS
jgi:4-alpha-glucanotransferase